VLNRAQTPDQPDWRTLSLQGAVLDQMGRHDEARGYYATALRIAPDEPSVLSNLGLSYALSKDLVRAESTLRRATAHGRADTGVQQNLAVVVALQGRLPEAETTARAHLTSGQGPAAMTHLRQRLAQQNGWKPQGESTSQPHGS
jgi:Flp pilus assembly protein TadD